MKNVFGIMLYLSKERFYAVGHFDENSKSTITKIEVKKDDVTIGYSDGAKLFFHNVPYSIEIEK